MHTQTPYPIQVDSKLYSTNFPVLLYPTPSEEEEEEVPAAEVIVEHVRHHLPGTVVFKVKEHHVVTSPAG